MDDMQSIFEKQDQLNMDNRKSPSFSDEFRLYKANIYDLPSNKDNRVQVRPLPFFVGIAKEEEKNLPYYPPMVKGKVITGQSEKKQGDACEQVWIIQTPDFQLGYVIDKTNVFGENTKKKGYPWSYNYKKIKEYLNARRQLPTDFDYEHLDVLKWYNSDNGGQVVLMNHYTGDLVYVNASGTCFTAQQKRIYMRVGTPPDPPSMGPAAFSACTMTPDKVLWKTPNFEIDQQDIVFGHRGLFASATPSIIPCAGTNGVSTRHIPNVHF